uniref:Uncharacterized protein n=1 Tax=Acrobeloides nanus TaxID=290746 RepID=A0A914CSC3_9BILA
MTFVARLVVLFVTGLSLAFNLTQAWDKCTSIRIVDNFYENVTCVPAIDGLYNCSLSGPIIMNATYDLTVNAVNGVYNFNISNFNYTKDPQFLNLSPMDIQSSPQLSINFYDTSCSFTTPATICPIPLQNCATTCPGATSVQTNIEYAYWTVFYDTNRDVGDSIMQYDYGKTINYNQKMFLPDESGRLFTKKNPNLLPVTLQRGLYNLQTENDSIAKITHHDSSGYCNAFISKDLPNSNGATCSKFYVVITKNNDVITNGTVKYLKPPNYFGKHGYGGVELDISAQVPDAHTLSFETSIGNIEIDMSFSKEYFLVVDHEYPDFFHYHTLSELGGLDEGYEVDIPVATVLSIDGVLLMNEDSAYTTNNACFNLSGTYGGFEGSFSINYTSLFCCVEWDELPSPTPNPVTTLKPSGKIYNDSMKTRTSVS